MTSVLAVTDTHALIWASTGKLHRLGRRARQHFERTEQHQAAVYVPAMVLAELSELQQLGRLTLPLPFAPWVEQLVASTNYIVADLSAEVVRHAHDLFEIAERGDRLIAATAVVLELPLMTRDGNIAECARVERLWD